MVNNSDPRVYYFKDILPARLHKLSYDDSWHDRDLTAETGQPPPRTEALSSCVVNNRDARVYCLAPADPNAHVHELAWFDDSWHDQDLTAASNGAVVATGSALSSCPLDNNELRVYYFD